MKTKRLKAILPLFPLILLLLLLEAFRQTAGPTVKFVSSKHNFGFVHQGDVLECDYELKNTGTATLLLYDAKVACQCTEVNKPDSVLPGKTGKIHLKFDSKSAIDRQVRTIELSTNAQKDPYILIFKCIVLKKKG